MADQAQARQTFSHTTGTAADRSARCQAIEGNGKETVMKKFFFWCVLVAPGCEPIWALEDVIANCEGNAREALGIRIGSELPGVKLMTAELVFSRCESLTEFIRKAA